MMVTCCSPSCIWVVHLHTVVCGYIHQHKWHIERIQGVLSSAYVKHVFRLFLFDRKWSIVRIDWNDSACFDYFKIKVTNCSVQWAQMLTHKMILPIFEFWRTQSPNFKLLLDFVSDVSFLIFHVRSYMWLARYSSCYVSIGNTWTVTAVNFTAFVLYVGMFTVELCSFCFHYA